MLFRSFNGVNHMFEGGLLMGNSATKLVNVVRNTGGTQDNDFRSRTFYSLTTPGAISDQDGFTNFNDSLAPIANRIGLSVNMHSYEFSSLGNDKYVIVRYDIQNISGAPVNGLRVGLFFDWDLGDATQNYSKYDATRSLAYAYDVGTTNHRNEYVGVRALDSASSCHALTVNTTDASRAGKWNNWLNDAFDTTESGPADIHQVISSGPYDFAIGAVRTIGFAIVEIGRAHV